MIHQRSQILCAWFLLWDLLLTAAAWVGAYYLRFESGWIPVTKDPPDVDLCWRNLPLVVAAGRRRLPPDRASTPSTACAASARRSSASSRARRCCRCW